MLRELPVVLRDRLLAPRAPTPMSCCLCADSGAGAAGGFDGEQNAIAHLGRGFARESDRENLFRVLDRREQARR